LTADPSEKFGDCDYDALKKALMNSANVPRFLANYVQETGGQQEFTALLLSNVRVDNENGISLAALGARPNEDRQRIEDLCHQLGLFVKYAPDGDANSSYIITNLATYSKIISMQDIGDREKAVDALIYELQQPRQPRRPGYRTVVSPLLESIGRDGRLIEETHEQAALKAAAAQPHFIALKQALRDNYTVPVFLQDYLLELTSRCDPSVVMFRAETRQLVEALDVQSPLVENGDVLIIKAQEIPTLLLVVFRNMGLEVDRLPDQTGYRFSGLKKYADVLADRSEGRGKSIEQLIEGLRDQLSSGRWSGRSGGGGGGANTRKESHGL